MTLVVRHLRRVTCVAGVGVTSRTMPCRTSASRPGPRSREALIDGFSFFFCSLQKLVSSNRDGCCNSCLEQTCCLIVFFVCHLEELIGCDDRPSCANSQGCAIGERMMTRLFFTWRYEVVCVVVICVCWHNWLSVLFCEGIESVEWWFCEWIHSLFQGVKFVWLYVAAEHHEITQHISWTWPDNRPWISRSLSLNSTRPISARNSPF